MYQDSRYSRDASCAGTRQVPLHPFHPVWTRRYGVRGHRHPSQSCSSCYSDRFRSLREGRTGGVEEEGGCFRGEGGGAKGRGTKGQGGSHRGGGVRGGTRGHGGGERGGEPKDKEEATEGGGGRGGTRGHGGGERGGGEEDGRQRVGMRKGKKKWS